MRAPLELIAARTGLSIATVSRALRNEPNVAEATLRKVLDAERALSPPSRSMLMIGLVIPDQKNPYFPALAFELDKECDRRGAFSIVASSDGRADRERHLLERFIEIGVDGVLFISSGSGQSGALLQALEHEDAPCFVALDRGIRGLDTVTVKSGKGTIEAIDHLVKACSHTRIGYIKGLPNTETAADRFDAFQAALASHRLSVPPEWVFEGNYQVDAGRECADRLLMMKRNDEERPTAILAANDLMAFGLIQRLSEEGWSLPRDLSVIGFDGIPLSDWITPKLATIAQPIDRLVQEAFILLAERITERRSPRSNGADPLQPRNVSLEATFKVAEHGSVAQLDQDSGLRLVEGGAP